MVPLTYDVSKIEKFIKIEWNGSCQSLGAGRNGKLLFNRYNVSVNIKWISSRDLLYNIVPLVTSTVLCTQKLHNTMTTKMQLFKASVQLLPKLVTVFKMPDIPPSLVILSASKNIPVFTSTITKSWLRSSTHLTMNISQIKDLGRWETKFHDDCDKVWKLAST